MSLGFSIKPFKLKELNLDDFKSKNSFFNMHDRNSIRTSSNKFLYVRKINNDETSKGEIDKIIHSSFNDPEKYFSENSPVQIGKKLKLRIIDLFNKKRGIGRKYTRRGPSKKTLNSTRMSDLNKSIYGKDKVNSVCNNDEIIDNNILKNMFESFKYEANMNKKLRKNEVSISRSINNLSKSNNYSINNYEERNNSNNNKIKQINYPFELYHSLDYQNKQIIAKKKNLKKLIRLSKFISKKIKKNEDDLLLNKVDLFKYKKDILSEINKEKDDDKFGKFKWRMSLRKPNDFKGIKKLFINVSNELNPFWETIVDRSPNYKELAVKPGYNLKQKEFIKFAKNENIQKNIEYLNNVKNLDDISVNGSNLLDLEYKREMSIKGKKILHKFFVENGKTILEQDINKVFGEETFYKNYKNRNKYNYSLSEINIGVHSLDRKKPNFKIKPISKKNKQIKSFSRNLKGDDNKFQLINT